MNINVNVDGKFHSVVNSYASFQDRKLNIESDEDSKGIIEIDMIALQQYAQSHIQALHAKSLDVVIQHVPIQDQVTWGRKLEYATSFLKGELHANKVDVISQALLQDETLEEYCQSIVSNASSIDDLIFFAEHIKRSAKKYIQQEVDAEMLITYLETAEHKMNGYIASFITKGQ